MTVEVITSGPTNVDVTVPAPINVDVQAQPITVEVATAGIQGTQGAVGPAPNIAGIIVSSSEPGGSASGSVEGDSPDYIINLTIPRGYTGPQGIAGFGIHTGTAPPSDAVGEDGDTYIVTSGGSGLGDTYTKTSGTWGSPDGNIRGPAGTSGGTGNFLFVQNAAPSSGMSTNDSWIDSDNDNLLNYYNGSAWTPLPFGTAAIVDSSITDAKIVGLSASKLTGTIDIARIGDGTLTDAKIADVAASKITGTIAIGNLPVAANGVSSSTQIVRANDARLSDARTPVAHNHSISAITGTTADRAIISDGIGTLTFSTVTSTELGYLSGVTSAVQTQINSKLAINKSGGSGLSVWKRSYDLLDDVNGSANVTASLVIQTNLTFNNYMTNLHVTGYNYVTDADDLDLNIGFYAYGTGPLVVSYGAVQKGNVDISQVRVMRRTSDNKVAIVIDIAGGTWQYPHIHIDGQFGFVLPPDSELTGWTATYTTDLSALTPMVSLTVRKSEAAITAGTTAQYWRGDKSWQTLDKTAVGLGLINNVAQVEIAGTQTITGAKTFSANTVFSGIITAGSSTNGATIPSGGAAAAVTANITSSLTSGIAAIGAYVNDGTRNYRAGLVVNDTDSVWGLTHTGSSGTIPFIIKSGSTEILRVTNAGALTVPSTITGTGATLSGLTANRALATGTGGLLVASAVTDTELGYVSGVTSALQTQLNNKQLKVVQATTATAAATAAKTATVASYTPATGDILALTLTNGNSASSPTLALNGGAAVSIYAAGAAVSFENAFTAANGTWFLQYNGTRWELMGSQINFAAATVAEMQAGSSTTLRWMSPSLIKSAINALAVDLTNNQTVAGIKTFSSAPVISALTANRALVTGASGVLAVSATTDTEIGYLSGVTSAVQTQLNGKATNTGGGKEVVAALSATTGTATGDLGAASVFTVTPTGNITLAFSNVPASVAVSTTIVITQGASAFTVTMPAGNVWMTTAPTQVANKRCIINMFTVNGGTTWYSWATVEP